MKQTQTAISKSSSSFSPIAPLFSVLSIIFILPTLPICLCTGLIRAAKNHLEYGLAYALTHYKTMLSVRKALLDAGYLIERQSFSGIVVEIPQIWIRFSGDMMTGYIRIQNSPKFSKKLENIKLSSSLENYIAEDLYLTAIL